MPTKAIDQLTEVPADVFEEFLKAGQQARLRGQHRLVTRTNAPNSICLYQSPRACTTSSPEPRSAVDRWRCKKAGRDERSILQSGPEIRVRATGEQKRQCSSPVQKRMVKTSSAHELCMRANRRMVQTSSACVVHNGSTVSGSAFRAASQLRRRPRTNSNGEIPCNAGAHGNASRSKTYQQMLANRLQNASRA